MASIDLKILKTKWKNIYGKSTVLFKLIVIVQSETICGLVDSRYAERARLIQHFFFFHSFATTIKETGKFNARNGIHICTMYTCT